ncbi:MAG: flagellar M-ring protein FliF [Candidatus Eremiobacteraeota bacterium]|nr:flagellar M-ring protein FliF [Candidatus Eremiobacteraeota bacterium]
MERLSSTWQEISARARESFDRLNPSQRLVGMIVGVAFVVGVAFWATLYGPFHKPPYAVLFSNLSASDAAAVTQKLKDDKVDYQLADNGTTVKVPQDVVYQERVDVAGSNILKSSGTGYELFDRTNLGMTDFQEKVAKTRAVEGELQRTIDGLSQVQSSRVHIATPDQTLYSSSQQPTTASVAITLKPGANLDPAQVQGITQLVSGAVEGLKPENVTLVDQNGNIMVPRPPRGSSLADAEAAAMQLTQEQLLAKQRYESTVQQSVQGMLDQTLGPKHAAARVAVDMNFDSGTSEQKSYSPNGTVRSEQVERENYNGQVPVRNPALGVPGTTTNVIGTYQGVQPQVQNGRYSKSKATRNFEITQTDAKHVDAPGKVTRMSVAVLVNVPANPATTPNAPYEVAAADVTKIKNVVSAAAGIDPTRGDVVSVEAVPFNPAVTAGAPGAARPTTVLGIPVSVLIALGIVALLVGIGFAAATMRRRAAVTAAGFRPPDELPTFDSTLAEELPPFQEHPMLEGAPGLAAPSRSSADISREQMIEYVTTVAQENPDSIAKLLKLWLAEA